MNNSDVKTKKFSLKSLLSGSVSTAIIFYIVLSLGFAYFANNFFGLANMQMLMKIAMTTITMSLAQMVFLSFGEKNNAVGSIALLSAVISAGSMELLHFNTGLAILVGLFIGALCGVVSSIICYRLGASGPVTFLVTLALQYVFRGVAMGLTSSIPFYGLNASYKALATGYFLKVPILFWAALGIALLLWVLYRRLGIGRQILAMGSNSQAAVYAGVNKFKVIMIAHILSGVIAAAAGMITSAKLGCTSMDIGSDWMMYSIAAPILGGTSQNGGKVMIFGTIIGAMILATVEDGLALLGADVYFNVFIEGMLILLAVVLDRIRNGKEE